MGGLAFASKGIAISNPRMSPAIYQEVRDRCQAVLKTKFHQVASPIEGPAKKDYGDVDILVAGPVSPADQAAEKVKDTLTMIRKLLGAEHMVCESDNSANLAIPWPEDLLPSNDDDGNGGEAQEKKNEQLHIQVDVRVCPSAEDLRWALFKHAHGDLWNVMGTSIRSLGLTVDEEALWLRIPEIEYAHRNRSKVRLTADPDTILDFLGLGSGDLFWKAPFQSVDDLFEYVASGRWFWVAPDKPEDQDDPVAAAAGSGDGGVAADKKKLKANDRRRMKSRPVYRAWVEEFLPKCRAEGRAVVENATETKAKLRLAVREEAFDRFDGVRTEYETRLKEWLIERQRDEILRSVIKGGVPVEGVAPEYRACVIRALRNILIPADDSDDTLPDYGIQPETPVRLADGQYDVEAAKDFVRDHWEDLGKAAWAIHTAKPIGHSGNKKKGKGS